MMEITRFIVPREICREVHINAADLRGVLVHYFNDEIVTLDFNGMLASRRVAIHRAANAPGLLARIGAIALTGYADPFELRDIIKPTCDPVPLIGVDGWLAIVAGVYGEDSLNYRKGDPAVLNKVLHPEGVRELWGWLTDWMNRPEAKHSGTRSGAFRSIAEEREYAAQWHSSAHDEPD